jgi:uncharacterized membrane protein
VSAPDSPSAWRHRVPVIVLSLAGLVVATILTLFLVGAFCTLCLTSALISLLVAGLVAPEVTATVRHLRQRRPV